MNSALTGPEQDNSELTIIRGRFRPGQSGNPAGRPKGARNKATIAAEALLEGQAEALTQKAIQLAMAGDVTALRLCVERLVPPRKDRPITLELPPIESAADVADAMAAVLRGVAEGRITPSEAIAVTGLIEIARGTVPAEAPAQVPGVDRIRISFVERQPESD
jgi:hypothetical protein